MSSKKQAEIFFTNAEYKMAAAKSLFNNKHYVECLFFCHLALELYLKGLITLKLGGLPPYTHDLAVLGKFVNINLDEKKIMLLEEINEFNLRARYDDYRLAFYKKATKQYTENYIKATNKLILWLRKNIH
jgi:HEPN domain-containing protein